MKPRSPEIRRWEWLGASASLLLAIAVAAPAIPVFGQSASPASNGRAASSKASGATPIRPEEGVRWDKLKPAQREALLPLQREWAGIDAQRKQKWLQLADRLPAMPPEERGRVQARMTDWARLSPAERGEARLRFQEATQIAPPDRRSRWEAYQALTPEQKKELSQRATPSKSASIDPAPRRSGRPERSEKAGREPPLAKSNIVPNPAYAPPPRLIAPTVVQAAPGATTTLVTRRPAPPPHQHVGLPKIAATPEFVNKSTLLPQRGAQGAAIRAVPAGDAPPASR